MFSWHVNSLAIILCRCSWIIDLSSIEPKSLCSTFSLNGTHYVKKYKELDYSELEWCFQNIPTFLKINSSSDQWYKHYLTSKNRHNSLLAIFGDLKQDNNYGTKKF